jgi:DNA polymerase I-like protein with 3'-5' exonuclease and polymerase domains
MHHSHLIRTREDVSRLIEHVQAHEYLAYDVESTGLNVRTSKIIGIAISGEIGMGYYLPLYEWDVEQQVLVDVLIDGVPGRRIAPLILDLLVGKRLIMHNGSYDVQITKNDLGVDLLQYLYIDTIVLVHTVREEGRFALKDISVSIQDALGFDVEHAANEEQIALKENVVKNGGEITKTNFEIYKADLAVLSPYATKDVDLTLRVCVHFLQRLREEGLERFFFEEEVMPLLREVTIPMEMAGVRVDLDYILEIRDRLETDMEVYRKKVVEALRVLPEFRKWVVDTALANYPPSNKGTYAQAVAEFYNLPLPLSEKSGKFSMTKKTLEALPDSPAKTFLMEGNVSVLPAQDGLKLSVDLWKKQEGDLINVQSKKQLAEVVFQYMGIQPLNQTEKGADQFDDDFVEHLADKHGWAKDLRVYNKLGKIKSSYVDRYLKRHENGRYYFYYNQHGTISGRYASDAQQLPRKKEEAEVADPIVLEYNNAVRAFFISDDGYDFIDCDYETLEPRVFAHVSTDQGLIDIFFNGWDFYSTIAIKTEKLEGVSADKKADNYLGKVSKPARQKAKAYSLGIPYGMSDYALALSIGVKQKVATELVNGYLDGFPALKQWMEDSARQAKELGYVKTQVGRVRHLDRVREIYKEHGDRILEWDYRMDLTSELGAQAVKDLYMDYKNGLNNARNFQIQSLAASIVNRAAIQINREFKRRGINGWVAAQIHDQIIVQVEKARTEEAKAIVRDKMENTTKLSLPLPAPPEVSHNWRDGH